MKATMTYHCEVQRANRVQHIVNEIGMGQIVREKYVRSLEKAQAGQPGNYLCVTDTGIMLVKSEDKLKIITMYVATYRELVRLYDGAGNIPKFLRKKVDHNQSLFTSNGKTIWR